MGYLDGFDDLVGHVAGQSKARGVGVQLHCPSQRLLRSFRHAAVVIGVRSCDLAQQDGHRPRYICHHLIHHLQRTPVCLV